MYRERKNRMFRKGLTLIFFSVLFFFNSVSVFAAKILHLPYRYSSDTGVAIVNKPIVEANMIKTVVSILFMLAVLLHAPMAGADESPEASLRQSYPEVRIASIQESPVAGLWEVLTAQGRIFYYDPKTHHRLFGEMVTQEGKNLTAARRAEAAAQKIDRLPIEKAIRIGNGKNIVIEFLDPDCPYCRRSSRFLKKQSDVTRYIFLIPIRELHPDAERKSKYILCAADKRAAYEEVFAGDLDDAKYEVCNDPKIEALLSEHREIAEEMGVRGTPVFFINRRRVDGANVEQIEKLLQNDTVLRKTERDVPLPK